MGNVITRNSRTDRLRVFVLGGKVGHVTRHVRQLLMVKRSKVKVTMSRNVSLDKNAVTRQWMVISTSNLVGIINVRVGACGILSRSVGQSNRKYSLHTSVINVAFADNLIFHSVRTIHCHDINLVNNRQAILTNSFQLIMESVSVTVTHTNNHG